MGDLSGPITGGTHGWPFSASVRDLSEVGYTETEHRFSGEAQRFLNADVTEYSVDGRWTVTEGRVSPFETRLIVRLPEDPARFNGTVVVNWNNVSNGFDNFPGLSDELIDAGVAWVGAAVQKVAIHGFPFGRPAGLTQWDPERYGGLTIADDDLSFDIFTQVARAVGPERSLGANDPMRGLPVERLLAHGGSQSAIRLATYYNAIQPVTEAFDGFLLGVYKGGGARIDLTTPAPEVDDIPAVAREVVNILPRGSHTLRTDVAAPVIVVNSESEFGPHRTARQADSDTYRLWEVAGTAHIGTGTGPETTARWARDFGEDAPARVALGVTPNALSFGPVIDAAFRHMERWMRGGPPPPVQDRAEFVGEPPVLTRDAEGNARGGIRLPHLEAATGAHRGETATGAPDSVGTTTPFSTETLRALYPTRESYLARFEAAVDAGLERGFLLERDAERLRSEAAAFGSDGLWDR
jgi:hypothetical protein